MLTITLPKTCKSLLSCAAAGLLFTGCASLGKDDALDFPYDLDALGAVHGELSHQRQQIDQQARIIAEQQRLLKEQQQTLAQIQDTFARAQTLDDGALMGMRGTGIAGLQATDDDDPSRSEPPPEKVGEAPEQEDAPPEIPAIADLGGVLTPRGVFVLEPAVSYTSNQTNRFVFSGTGIATALLIGSISATDADRDTWVTSLGARYGVTNRFEVDVKLPYVRRDDRQTNLIPNDADEGADFSFERDLSDSGLGDIEFGAHYQINRGLDGWPYFVGNLRVKSDTGTGPFDVDRDAEGIQTELATGSGFWSVQPSLTMIFPSDPAVFYGNLSYLYNFERDVNTVVNSGVGPAEFGKIDPGDAIGLSFGVGLGLNQRSSFNLGYEHQYILKTESELRTAGSSDPFVNVSGETLQVGSFQFGLSYSLSQNTGMNLSLSIGATEDAPDMSASLRFPMTFEWF